MKLMNAKKKKTYLPNSIKMMNQTSLIQQNELRAFRR